MISSNALKRGNNARIGDTCYYLIKDYIFTLRFDGTEKLFHEELDILTVVGEAIITLSKNTYPYFSQFIFNLGI